jgi:glycine betaine/proline transport system substrate-binding protein
MVVLAAACGDDSGDAISAPAVTAVELSDDLAATTVRPGRANWSTGYFQAAVYSALLRELGYTVLGPELNEHPPAEAYLAMAQGEFDFWPNGWYSQHYTWHERELEDGSLVGEHLVVLGDQMAAGGLEGLVITKSVAAEHGIESLGQINDDPELTALFDADGNGLAEILGCPDDWTCDDIIDEIIEFNGWSNLEQVKAGYPGLVATSIDRVENAEPVIQYT